MTDSKDPIRYSDMKVFNHYWIFPVERVRTDGDRAIFYSALSERSSPSYPGQRIRYEHDSLDLLALAFVKDHMRFLELYYKELGLEKKSTRDSELSFTFAPPSPHEVYVTDDWISTPNEIVIPRSERERFCANVQSEIMSYHQTYSPLKNQ